MNSVRTGTLPGALRRSPRALAWLQARDPVLLAAGLAIAAIVVWSSIPLATGASASSDTQIQLNVPTSMVVTPGLTNGDTSVTLPDLTTPGQTADASSDGWQVATNHVSGYELRIRSTTDPALRSKNDDGARASSDSFLDFKTAAECPCPWTTSGYSKGVFGYSAQISTASGGSVDGSKWGSSGSRRWRGLDDSSYQLFQTPGGAGNYRMSLFFRSAIAPNASQKAGRYRATVILSIHALL